MKTSGRGAFLLALATPALLSSCAEDRGSWTPVMEETSTVFLKTESERILGHVQEALESLEAEPDRSGSALREAESGLEHLLRYYLPLMEARERAYNAYRSFYLGDGDRVADELEEIEGIFDSMVPGADEGRLREIQSLADALAEARIATMAGGEEARRSLETLAQRLNLAVLKGDLILGQ